MGQAAGSGPYHRRLLWLAADIWAEVWHGFTAAAVAAVALVAAGLGAFWMMYTPVQPQLIVVLLDAEASRALSWRPMRASASASCRLARFNIPEGKVLQVWTATGPVPLGLLDGARNDADRPRSAFAAAGAALRDYPVAGGSPTGRPTVPSSPRALPARRRSD